MKRAKSKGELICDKLVEDILNNRIYPGERLVESDLAKRFAVSRMPIREALLKLEEKGFTTHRRNIGAVVTKVTGRRAREAFELLAELEAYAAEVAVIEGIDEKEIVYLQTQQDAIERQIKRGEYAEFNEMNLQFHSFFVSKTGNDTLQQIVADLRNRIRNLLPEELRAPRHIKAYLAFHRRIIDAVRAGDAFKAKDLMKKHLREAMKLWIESDSKFLS
jgi:DNA-binding GntR family transcriptional regulator